VELESTPFFPQTRHHCGPAALATILVSTGLETSPDALSEQVFLPDRQGTLQPEVLAATRGAGRIPVRLEPSPQSLVDTVASGKPVLVFLNLGIPSRPHWHYAVLIGYLPESAQFVLRSGATRRKKMSLRRFLYAWEWAGRWAMVAFSPGETTDTVSREAYESALLDLADTAQDAFALRAFRETARIYPESGPLWAGYGNAAWSEGKLAESVNAFQRLVKLEPENPAAHNNLAHALLTSGCVASARRHAEQALDLLQGDELFRPAVESTLREVRMAPDEDNRCVVAE
jgi:hypothetical protein